MAAASFPDGIIAPIKIKPDIKIFTVQAQAAIDSSILNVAAFTVLAGANQFSGFFFAPTIMWSGAQVLTNIPAFWAQPTFRPSTAVADSLTFLSGMNSQPIYKPMVPGASTPTVQAYLAVPTIAVDSGTAAVGLLAGLNCFPSILGVSYAGTGATAAIMAGVVVNNPAVAQAPTVLVGVDLAAMSTGVTNLSIRSAGGEMRHAGTGVFGTNAARTNASVALEVQSTTQAFLLPRVTNTAAVVTPANGMMIYDVALNTPRVFAAGAWRSI